jgi:hypothetical protein
MFFKTKIQRDCNRTMAHLEREFIAMCEPVNELLEWDGNNVKELEVLYTCVAMVVFPLYDTIANLRKSNLENMKETVMKILAPFKPMNLSKENCISIYRDLKKGDMSSVTIDRGELTFSDCRMISRLERKDVVAAQEFEIFAYEMQCEIKKIMNQVNEFVASKGIFTKRA